MTDFAATNGNGNGSKLPVLPVLSILSTASVGALTAWIFRADDRLFGLIRDVPTRAELQVLRNDLTGRLDRIDAALAAALAAQRTPALP